MIARAEHGASSVDACAAASSTVGFACGRVLKMYGLGFRIQAPASSFQAGKARAMDRER
jgi:hypothetical protein